MNHSSSQKENSASGGMDALTDVLAHIRSSGALLGQTLANPPWSAAFEEQASLSLVTMLRGDASRAELSWLVSRNVSPVVRPALAAIYENTEHPGPLNSWPAKPMSPAQPWPGGSPTCWGSRPCHI